MHTPTPCPHSDSAKHNSAARDCLHCQRRNSDHKACRPRYNYTVGAGSVTLQARFNRQKLHWQWLGALALAVCVAFPLVSLGHMKQAAQRAERAGLLAAVNVQPAIVMYAPTACAYCHQAREFFAAHGLRYTELDIENSAHHFTAYRHAGAGSVPLIRIGERSLNGFDAHGLRTALRPWLKID
ncbi:glutaredoxin family protein [Undibacterium sp. CCC2.1]|uniref:glutaredoxin family protein n=1 Tax=unclassified Undibacterium TaxID=2630295 RepID=UPI002B22FD66|nr:MULTISPECIES: glutaredoxin family protein [unclassified Undibacterium]MEB0138642.1 glutaredoxin family protein [Undibacterium sp. CCC2.1]MEB0171443.1 glutaredoxin family protein [Undibacterium sp. CCC1.1]MEB0175773.1 glutaredoxin family protein [Undibacterium sp. CCC3.4]MEB0214399.1 glutaredoxin family protein [Undibacterium sp. 5I2]